MNRLPFSLPGRFYRGNLHTHSTRSDGARSPADVIATYRESGYDFLALTDHFLERYNYPIVDTREFRSDTFTTLIGAELHGSRTEIGEMWHILAVGLPLDFARPGAAESGPAIAARATAAGAFVGMAHPSWYSLTLSDALSLEACDAVEVWNQVAAIDNDRGDSWYMSDLLSSRGVRLGVYAADDAHFRNSRDDRKAWVNVRSTSLAPESLLTALKAGHYYSSQGPEIVDLQIAGMTLNVKCTPAEAIFATGRGPVTDPRWGAGLVDASFNLERFAGSYVRITILDVAGKRAWTNPIWVNAAR